MMGRRRGAASGRAFALALCVASLHLVSLQSAAAQPNVANACKDVQCFSGVVAACGSCLPTTAPAFCKAPCQASWGGLDTITCLGQAGNSYWLNNIQSLNVKCGLPPIPNAAAAAGGPADGGLGAVAGAPEATATAAGAAAPATKAPITVTSGTGDSLSGTPAPKPTAAAAVAAAGAGAAAAGAPGATAAGAAGGAAGGASDLSGAGTAAVGGSSAAAGAASSSTVGATTAAGGTGSGGTAGGNGTAVSSAIAAFGCTMQGTRLNIAVASECVTSVTQSNQCTQPCQAQFALFAPVCRNTMVQDEFYGKTWQGIFKACQISASTDGQVIANQQAANLAAGPTVSTAATQVSTASSQSDPLILAIAPTSSDQGASSSMVLRAAPLLVATAAALLLL